MGRGVYMYNFSTCVTRTTVNEVGEEGHTEFKHGTATLS